VPQKTVICLANSKKLGARCVAGVEQDSQTWIRPMGSGSHGAITLTEQTLNDGSRPELLDQIEMQLGEPMPQPGQPENWSLAPGQWRRVGHVSDHEARDLLMGLSTDAPVFGTNERSVSVAEVAGGSVTSSLAVVRPQDLNWEKRRGFTGGTQIRGQFVHAEQWHDLPLTDPAFLGQFVNFEIGDYAHSAAQEVFLVISLGEPMNEEHWKLIAGVIGLPV
jgi:hypothetical protein